MSDSVLDFMADVQIFSLILEPIEIRSAEEQLEQEKPS